jgi:hypothetical protein
MLCGLVQAAQREQVLGQVEAGVHFHFGDGSTRSQSGFEALLVPVHGPGQVADLPVHVAHRVETANPENDVSHPLAGGERVLEEASGDLVLAFGGSGVGLVEPTAETGEDLALGSRAPVLGLPDGDVETARPEVHPTRPPGPEGLGEGVVEIGGVLIEIAQEGFRLRVAVPGHVEVGQVYAGPCPHLGEPFLLGQGERLLEGRLSPLIVMATSSETPR